MEQLQQAPPPLEQQPPPMDNIQQRGHFFKLPDFWPASPLTWFGIVEAQFDLRSVTSQRERFSLVAAVLPESSARKITHLLAAPPAECYTALKAALLQSHVLTDMQRMELLFNMDNLGSKRPMDLLTEMLELVKPGEENTQLFAMLFMRRLPPPVRVQLTEDDHTDLRALAAKADRCTAFLSRQTSSATIASVSSTSEELIEDAAELSISAMSRGGGRGGKQRGGRFQGNKKPPQQPQQQRGQQQQQRSGQSEDADSPLDLARLSSGLCFYHFTFGSKARSCSKPCAWQGN